MEDHFEFRRIEKRINLLQIAFERRGAVQVQRFCPSIHAHRRKQTRQAEEMVAMEMRDDDGGNGLQLQVVVAYAVLRGFGTVDEQFEASHVEQLCRAASCTDG